MCQPSPAEIRITCIGCENECEVSVAFRDGRVLCLGGNNCPTGESYALAQAERRLTCGSSQPMVENPLNQEKFYETCPSDDASMSTHPRK